MNTTLRWAADNRPDATSRSRDRLCVATAIVDGVFVSALLWLALLLIMH